MRKHIIGLGETISRNGRPVGLGLACWPREWKPVGVDGQEVGVGFHFNIGHLISGAIHDVGKVASGAVKDVDKVASGAVKDVGKAASGAIKDVGNIATEAVKDPGKLLHDAVHDIGGIAKEVVKIDKFVLEQVQGLVSLIPGIGTAISVAIAAGLAALEGGSPLDIAIKIAYAAIPIPPGIKTFTDLVLGAVLDIIDAVIKGGDLAKVLERLIAEELARALPDNVRAAGANVLATLTPTVLQAVTGKLPSVSSIASTAAAAIPGGVPGLPALPAGLPTIPGVPAISAALPVLPGVPALPAGLPALPAISVPSIPGVTGLGDRVDDFVTQLQSQYSGMNLPANVKSSIDPIFNALVSMIHSMNVGPAILLAVRTGVGSKLPAGAPRDVGLRVFDTLAHLILGKMFKGQPTQAKVTAPLSKDQLTALHRTVALGQPLPASVTPVPPTAAAYQPLAQTEKAQSTAVSVALPTAIGASAVYGPYPQPGDAGGASAPAASPPATAMVPPTIPAAPGAATPPAPAAGTTAGVGYLDRGGGGHGGSRGGGRHPAPRGGGWGRPWGGSGAWSSGGGPWWPYVVAAPGDGACANWGEPISCPAAIAAAARTTLTNSGGRVAVRGADGELYLLSLERGYVVVRPCVSAAGVGDAGDDAVLRAMALDLLASLRRGVPQGATRAVKNFQIAWNAASVDTQIATDAIYTRETEGALNAALNALASGSGAAPTAVL